MTTVGFAGVFLRKRQHRRLRKALRAVAVDNGRGLLVRLSDRLVLVVGKGVVDGHDLAGALGAARGAVARTCGERRTQSQQVQNGLGNLGLVVEGVDVAVLGSVVVCGEAGGGVFGGVGLQTRRLVDDRVGHEVGVGLHDIGVVALVVDAARLVEQHSVGQVLHDQLARVEGGDAVARRVENVFQRLCAVDGRTDGRHVGR